MRRIIDLYRQIKDALQSAGIEEADAEARLIAAEGLQISLGELFLKADMQTEYDPAEILRKRISGMPIAYAMNKKYFMGFPFYVDGRVLIPRQDTETVVDTALLLIKQNGYKTVLDLCCGSGCMGIAIAKLAGVRALGSDISPGAAEVANKNAEALQANTFRAVAGDLFENIDGKFDMIVCNPPYITDAEYQTLEKQVREFEPEMALLGNLSFYEKIAGLAAGFMNKGGALVFEIGSRQKNDVEAILLKNHFKNICCQKDLAGRDRALTCTIN